MDPIERLKFIFIAFAILFAGLAYIFYQSAYY